MSSLETKIEGKWNELKGKAQQKWAELTDGDFNKDMTRESFIDKIDKKTSEAREDIEHWFDKNFGDYNDSNWETKIKGQWNEFKGKAQQKWASLTDDDFDDDHDFESMVNTIKDKTGEAADDIKNWFKKTF